MKNKKGFTLIEMLVAVLIIGILAAIALPQYRHVVDKTRYAALMDITKAIADANERFYLVNDRYSTNFRELDVEIPANRYSGNGAEAYFDWGNCILVVQQEVQCTNNTSLQNQFIIEYNQNYRHSYRNKILCTAKGNDENSRYDKVCKSFGEFWHTDSCNILGACRIYIIRR